MLSAFVRAVDVGSFASAARELGITPAALGQSVRRLEQHFGVRLLNRTTRSMHPTSDGRRLAARLRGPLLELEEAERVFIDERSSVSGVLSVSAPLGLGKRQVLPLAAKFRARHPGVEFDFDFSDTVRDFATGEWDLAFRILRPSDSNVVARAVSKLEAVTVASPLYLSRAGTPRHPRELEGHAVVGYRFQATGQLAPLVFRVGGREVRVAPKASTVVNDVDAACEAVALGFGIGQPPAEYAKSMLASGRVVEVLRAFRATPWRLYVCYPQERKLPMRVRSFVDFAVAELGTDRLSVAR